jgi:hypothetical protein
MVVPRIPLSPIHDRAPEPPEQKTGRLQWITPATSNPKTTKSTFFIFILVMHESNGLRLYDKDEHITRTGGELMYGRSCRESCRTTDFIYFELNIRYR